MTRCRTRRVSNLLTSSLPHLLTSLRSPRRLQKTFEQRPEFARSPEALGMPLDAETDRRGGVLDRLDDAVGCGRDHLEAGRESLDCLMMPAVDLAGIGAAPSLA